jgi:hypothetical protein
MLADKRLFHGGNIDSSQLATHSSVEEASAARYSKQESVLHAASRRDCPLLAVSGKVHQE